MKLKILCLLLVLCSCAHSKEVTLTWDRPGGNDIRYTVMMSDDGGSYFDLLAYTPNNTYTFKDVPTDRLVYFKIVGQEEKNTGNGWAYMRGWWCDEKHQEPQPTHLVIHFGDIK